MAMHLLTAREVMVARIGDHADGGGCFLRVKEGSASFVMRFTSPSGRRREFGLGACNRSSLAAAGKSLTDARDAAEEARRLLRAGRDPIDERRGLRDAARVKSEAAHAQAKSARATLARVGRDYHETVIEPTRTTKHSAQWIQTLETHVFPKLGERSIAEITAPELLPLLAELQLEIPETAARVRQRLDAIFEHALFHGLVRSNPAASLKRKLREGKAKRERGHHAAMAYRRVPAFMTKLRAAAGTAVRCLEFTILTAARTAEALLATWDEFDLETGVWTIPAERMKAREAHVVFLGERALEILRGQAGQGARIVFPSVGDPRRPLSNMALLMALRRLKAQEVTVHGFRASFSSWANECSIAKPDAIEAALAHRETNLVRRAYNRAAFLLERRALMSAWDAFCAGKPVTRADGSLVTEAQLLAFPGRVGQAA